MTDFAAYSDSQRDVAAAYADADGWSRMAGLNIARVGGFSSDRTVREYAREIWHIEPVKIDLDPYDGGGAAE
jgi:starch phosphorylase